MTCSLCEREKLLAADEYPYLIHEFKHSWWLLGEHQYYQGYSVLLVKGHVREMTDFSSQVASEVFSELLKAHSVIERVFKPHKMNLCSLGNVVDHLHWHLFPRYADDPRRENPPWLQMQDFASKNISPEEAQATILTLRTFLK
ncbi:MAG: HIT family protein [Bacteriovoracaceae bacterium]|nr:HIT family protein [Bacteriovoracaceae bacterium]